MFLLKGYLFVGLAAILWASSGTLSKYLFLNEVTPFELVQARLTLSSLILFLFLFFSSRDLTRIRRRDLGYFMLLGCLGMAMVQVTYFYTISKIQVAAAIFLQYMAPIFVALYSFLFMRERFTTLKLAALFLALGGCYLVVGGYDIQLLRLNRVGLLSGLLAALFFSIYTLLGEKGMRYYSPWTTLAYAFLFAAMTWNLLEPPFYFILKGYSPVQWAIILYIVIFGTIIPFGLYFQGIELIRSTRAIITATLEPVSAGVMAYLIIGESLEFLQMAGGVLAIGGIVTLQIEKEIDALSPAIQKRNAKGRELTRDVDK